MRYLKTSIFQVILIVFFYVSFVFTGCSTSPDFSEKNYPGILASEGRVLIYFNLEKDNVLINNFLSLYSDNDFTVLIDRTDRVSISIDSFGNDSEFDILAEGNFPRFFTNLAIGREEGWVKHKGVYTFWENEIDGLYASVPLNSVAIISNTDIGSDLEYIESGKRNYIPDIIKAEFENSALIIYSHLPGLGIYKSLNISSEKMFIQDIFFAARKDGDNYSISGELDFLNEKDAKIFSTVLKLGLLMNLRTTGRTSIMKIIHDGRIDAVNNRIIIDNISLTSNEILELLAGNRVSTQGN
ncbi:MAG: hypothetical protein DRI73_06850 [Bacteroidetes bacterium]|nr:MAG: hypothetical protein DRI73_06850 [Bacteroidota bacterium]